MGSRGWSAWLLAPGQEVSVSPGLGSRMLPVLNSQEILESVSELEVSR